MPNEAIDIQEAKITIGHCEDLETAAQDLSGRYGRRITVRALQRAFKAADERPPSRWLSRGDSLPTGVQSSKVRLILPDIHGVYQDYDATKAVLGDCGFLDPDEVLQLGDMTECTGIFSNHPAGYPEDLEYSYDADIAAGKGFLEDLSGRCPRAKKMLILGNHDERVGRWAAKTFTNAKDASSAVRSFGPETRLGLRDMGFEVFRTNKTYHNLAVPGTIRLGKCLFTHGYKIGKHATADTVIEAGGCIVHGHTHRRAEYGTRTIVSETISGWCPGTLSLLQPMWRHNQPTGWSHGYAVQFYESDGRFFHMNVPIVDGESMLSKLMSTLRPRRLYGSAA